MKILVCGGSGFLGSHVADCLTDTGHEVVIFDLKKSPFLRKEQSFVLGNILDERAVEKAMQGCDVVYNFAGIADMDRPDWIGADELDLHLLPRADIAAPIAFAFNQNILERRLNPRCSQVEVNEPWAGHFNVINHRIGA